MPLIILLFLCISILFYPSMGVVRVEYALILIFIVFFGISKILPVLRVFKVEIIILICLIVLSTLGLFKQSMTLGHIANRDYMFILRLGFYISMFLFAGIACFKMKTYRNDVLYLHFIGSIFIVLTICQYYNLFGINQLIQPHAEVIGRMQILVEQAGWRRAFGTLGNPNYWGLLLSVLACVVSYRLFWDRRWIYAPLLLGLLGSVVLTGSRAALVGYVGAMVIGGGLFLLSVKKRPSVMVAVMFAILGIMAVVRFDLANQVETSDRYSLERLNTLELRIKWWGHILGEMSEDPISIWVGQGTRKDTDVVLWADNAYIKVLRENGLISLFPYLFLVLYMIRRTLKLYGSIDANNRAWPGGLCLLLLAWAIFDLSADTWYGPRQMAAILCLYAFVHMIGVNRLGDKPVRAPSARKAMVPPSAGSLSRQ